MSEAPKLTRLTQIVSVDIYPAPGQDPSEARAEYRDRLRDHLGGKGWPFWQDYGVTTHELYEAGDTGAPVERDGSTGPFHVRATVSNADPEALPGRMLALEQHLSAAVELIAAEDPAGAGERARILGEYVAAVTGAGTSHREALAAVLAGLAATKDPAGNTERLVRAVEANIAYSARQGEGPGKITEGTAGLLCKVAGLERELLGAVREVQDAVMAWG